MRLPIALATGTDSAGGAADANDDHRQHDKPRLRVASLAWAAYGQRPMSPTRRMSGEQRREQILDVARNAFRHRGYRATTREVAEAAGVSDTLVIKHFGSKEALFRAAVAEPLFKLMEQSIIENRQLALADGSGSVEERRLQLREWAIRWAASFGEQQSLVLALLREAPEFPDLGGQVLAMLRALVEEVAATVEELTSGRDYVDVDARVATYATIGAVTAAVIMGADIEDFTDKFYEMMLFGILSPTARTHAPR